MPKSPLFRALIKAIRLSQLTNRKRMPPADEMREWLIHNRQTNDWTRRRFIKNTLQSGIALGVASVLPGCGPQSGSKNTGSTSGPRIAIVGAGIAGLYASYLLKQGGIKDNSLQIFEGSNRTGGRLLTAQLFGNNMTTELGGEFLDSTHTDMFDLARQFNITVLDRQSDGCIPEAYFFENKRYSFKDVVKAFQKCSHKIAKDAKSVGENYDTPDCERLDRMSLKQYIDSLETDTWFKKLLDVAYTGEYGLATEEQSALNLVDMIGEQHTGFEIFGESDERFKLLGGNQQICDRLAEEVQDHLHLGHTLVAVKNHGERFVLSFSVGNSTKDVEADFVIMTIPYTVLRNIEGIDKLTGITPEKLQCIQELGYGTNGKIFLGLNERPWRSNKGVCYQGALYSEKIHTGWDSYHLQNNNEGASVYTIFLGGEPGTQIAGGAKNSDYALIVDNVFPGFRAAHNPAHTAAMNWATNAMAKGSYVCYKPGQWTDISGQEMEPIGNMLFAGEHCSENFQGYMNGAAETGRMAAEKILMKVGVPM